MSEPALEALLGHMAVVQGGVMPLPGLSHSFFGTVEEVDQAAVMLRSTDGELLYIPRDSIVAWRDLGMPERDLDRSAADRLLRPSAAPDADTLLRSAGPTGSDADVLPRVVDEPAEQRAPKPRRHKMRRAT